MAHGVVLILQIPRGSSLAEALAATPPAVVAAGEAVVEHSPVDEQGVLEPPRAGRIVLSAPSPETLARDAEEIRRVLERDDSGDEPLVIVIEDAEELRDEQLAPVVEAAKRMKLPVILRVVRS